MYYRLGYEYPTDEDGGYYEVDDGIDLEGVRSWALGQPFGVALPNPIRIPLQPVSQFRGSPPDMIDGYMCLMSATMVATLQALGADNVAAYPALLEDRAAKREFDYRAVNLLGLVAAADLAASRWQNLDGEPRFDTHFERLALVPGRAGGRLIFRLAEDTSAIIVHERAKQALEGAGLKTLRYTPLPG